MTRVSRWSLGVLLTSAALLGSAVPVVGQQAGRSVILIEPDAPPAEAEAGPGGAASTNDLLTFIFGLACLAGGVIAVLVAARVYNRFRVDNPIIAAVNDPWVKAKIAQELSAPPDGDEVELSPADGRSPGRGNLPRG